MALLFIGANLLLIVLHSLAAPEAQLNEEDCGFAAQYIVSGTTARPHQFPWVVFLELHFPSLKTRCGGSIVTKRHVLTAAHCTTLNEEGVAAIDVIYGNTDIKRGARLKVTKVLLHPEYNQSTFFNDIAILLVEKPFRYGRDAIPICLPTTPMNLYNTDAVVAGWGSLSMSGNVATDHLLYTEVMILQNKICARIYKNYREDINYCAFRNHTDACQGDSGGPLFTMQPGHMRYVQVGIVSHGYGCAITAGVYTRVEAYFDWVEKSTRSLEGYMDLPL